MALNENFIDLCIVKYVVARSRMITQREIFIVNKKKNLRNLKKNLYRKCIFIYLKSHSGVQLYGDYVK